LYAGEAHITAEALLSCSPNAILFGVGSISAVASILATGTILGEEWSPVTPGSESWTNVTPSSDTWTVITAGGSSWTDISIGSDTWTTSSSSNDTWSQI